MKNSRLLFCLLLICSISIEVQPQNIRALDNKGTIRIVANGVTTWFLTDSYVSGQYVEYNNKIYRANDNIPANTTFVEGSSGATWIEVSPTDANVVPLWKSTTNGGDYATNDIINYNGILYKNLTGTNTDTTPNTDNTNWDPLLQFTEGSIPFANVNGRLTEDNTNLFYNNTNDNLGIGTNTPDASSVLELESITAGFLPPRMQKTQMEAISSPKEGLIVYSYDCFPKGIYVYDGANWISTFGGVPCLPEASISTLDCAGAVTTGILINSVSANGVTSTISYTGGNAGGYPDISVASTGVVGLTATAVSGTLATGTGDLIFTITGTPNSGGLASFNINFGGQSCTLNLTVEDPAVSALDCAGATTTGTLINGASASGVTSTISYTGGNGASYPDVSVASTGVMGLTATAASSSLATGTGDLIFTITGTPNSDGLANFNINFGGQSCILTLTVDPPNFVTSSFTYTQTSGDDVSSVVDDGINFNTGLYATRSVRYQNGKMWVVEYSSGRISQYSVTNVDISTATLDGVWDPPQPSGNIFSIFISSNGNRIHLSGASGVIYEYDLGSNNDVITTVPTNTGNTFNLGFGSASEAFYMVPDGTKFFAADGINGTVREYTLPTPYSLVGATYSGNSLDVSNEDSSVLDILIDESGTKLITLGNVSNDLFQYDLPTPYSLVGATYNNATNNSYGTMTGGNPWSIVLLPNSNKLITLNYSGRVYQESIGTNGLSGSYTITDNDSNGVLGTLLSAGDTAEVSGTSSNDGTVTVTEVIDVNQIKVSETLTNETVNSTITKQ